MTSINGIKTKETGYSGSVTLYSQNASEKWAIMLPHTNLGAATVDNGEIVFDGEAPELSSNDYITNGITINSVRLATAWDNGATVTVTYNHEWGEASCTFLNQGGTFEFQSGAGPAGTDVDMAKAMMIDVDNADNLIFKQNYYDTLDDDWENSGFQITFNRTTKKCTQWYGPDVANLNPSFISLSVNDVDITNQLDLE